MLSRRPFFTFACAYAGGIALGSYTESGIAGPLMAIAFAGFVFAFAWRRRGLPDAAAAPLAVSPMPHARIGAEPLVLLLAALLAATGWWSYRARRRHLRQAAAILPARETFDVTIRVKQPPERVLAGDADGFWRCTGAVVRIGGGDCPPVPVLVYGRGTRAMRRGDRLRGEARRLPATRAAFRGGFSYREYLDERQLAARVRLAEYTVEAQPSRSPLRWSDRLRAGAVRNTLRLLPGEGGAFLAAAMFGYRRDLEPEQRAEFRRAGIAHVMAISGLHVGLVVGLSWWLLSWFVWRRRHLAAVCIGICLAYLALSGCRTAALRAAIMATVYLGGFVLARRSDIVNSLGAAALILLAINPFSLFGLGFRLSFVAVLFISRIAAEGERLLPTIRHPSTSAATRWSTWWRRVAAGGVGLGMISAAGWLGVMPLTALAYQEVAPLGLITNILALPLMSLVLAGGIALQLGAFLPQTLALPVAWVAVSPTRVMLHLASWGAVLPGGGMAVYPPPAWLVGSYYVAFGLLFLRPALKAPLQRRRLTRAMTLLLVLIGLAMFYAMRASSPPRASITLLPARGEEIAILENDAGRIAVIGPLERGGADVAKYLRRHDRDRVDCVIQTRGDTELRRLRDAVQVDRIVSMDPERAPEETDAYRWRDLPGVDGASWYLSRDSDGRVVWLAFRCAGMSCLVTRWCWRGQFEYRMEKSGNGADAPLALLRIRKAGDERAAAKTLSAPWVFLGHAVPETGNVRGYERDRYGALRLTRINGLTRLRAYDGEDWLALPRLNRHDNDDPDPLRGTP